MTALGDRPRHRDPDPFDVWTEWRWRNYAERLTDLYDLDGGAAEPAGARDGTSERDATESGELHR